MSTRFENPRESGLKGPAGSTRTHPKLADFQKVRVDGSLPLFSMDDGTYRECIELVRHYSPQQERLRRWTRIGSRDHGDAKVKSEGKADQAKGKVQNAIGGLKDKLRGE
jgi:hypothetical protein